MKSLTCIIVTVMAVGLALTVGAGEPTMKYTTEIPTSVITPDRAENVVIWPGSKSWEVGFAGGRHESLNDGVSLINSRVRLHFYATGITPAMLKPPVGAGSQYVIGLRDEKGQTHDGSKTYRVHVPPNVPAKRYWDITIWDNQARSLLLAYDETIKFLKKHLSTQGEQ